MKDTKPHRASTAKVVAIAIVLGLAAGAAAVYVTGSGSGNPPSDRAAGSAQAAGAKSADCSGAKSVAEALKPYTTGTVAAMSPQDEPRSFSAMAFRDAAGKPVSLADYAGKTLLVNVWATWCVPCRAEMPALDALEAARGGDGFQVVAVNVDTGGNAKPRKFLKQVGADHIVLHRDPTMGVFNNLKEEGLAFGLPVTLLVGRSGCLLAAMNGPAAWDSPAAAKLIDAAVKLEAGKSGTSS